MIKRILFFVASVLASAASFAAITFVGNGAPLQSSASAVVTIPCPTPVLAGDFQVIYRELDGTGGTLNVNEPSGFTSVYSPVTPIRVSARVAAAGDPNPTSNTATSTTIQAICVTFRGVDVTGGVAGAIDVTTHATNSSQTIMRVPAATPAAANEAALYFGRSNNLWTGVTVHSSFTHPTGAGGVLASNAFTFDYWIQTTLTAITQTDLTITGNPSSSTQNGIVIFLKPAATGGGGGAISVTSVDGDNIVTSTQTGVVIAGTNMGASQGAGAAQLRQASCTRNLTVTGWTATAVTVTMSQGACLFGPGLSTVRVTENGGTFAEQAITFNPPSGTSFVNLTGGVASLVFNSVGAPTRLYGFPLDLQSTSQVAWRNVGGSGNCTIATNAAIDCPNTVTSFDYDFSRDGQYLGTFATWNMRGLPPRFSGPKVGH